ncbi:MAG: NTP transferase domain-containing protein [Leptospira sp.]|nr:NTP transferase domain-containing protein [Leptospira sp.]
MNTSSQICAVILAAGKGTRMKSDLPKVAVQLNDKPLICHVVENLLKAGIQDIVVIVGYKKEEVISLCKPYKSLRFVEQKEQLGTGHALLCAEDTLKNFNGTLIVACGDVPMISTATFQSLIDYHIKNNYEATVLSADLENPHGYGRIVRNHSGALVEIVEEKDADEETRKIREINTGTYCFNSPAVFLNLKKIGKDNAQGEYYLPDLIRISGKSAEKSGAMKLLNSIESSGINSIEDLEKLSYYIKEGRIAV